ncbi:hypothetical protein FOL47_010761, partial [Perkinsus chesapeaki]
MAEIKHVSRCRETSSYDPARDGRVSIEPESSVKQFVEQRKLLSLRCCTSSDPAEADVLIEALTVTVVPRQYCCTCEVLQENWPVTALVVNGNGRFKPRKWTFVVKVHGGKDVFALVGMLRPFKSLRELDVDETAGEVKSECEVYKGLGGSTFINMLDSGDNMNPMKALAFALLGELNSIDTSSAYGDKEGHKATGLLEDTHVRISEQISCTDHALENITA